MSIRVFSVNTISRLSGKYLKNNCHKLYLSREYCGRGYVKYLKKFTDNTNDLLNKQTLCHTCNRIVYYSTNKDHSALSFEKISDETLESLNDYFDQIIEQADHLEDADVSFGDGVLTVKFGNPYGTYVINRQTPNKQIWLSSPKSGPKRYDYTNGKWIYKHDGKSLHELLNSEIPDIVKFTTSFDKCCYSGNEEAPVHGH
ncbi:frataxin, mitochondrial [Prorops nasuta]|uniref:frataxin, mitochondrial n=1 Tax=Prorops nasuta TaxID=863751 RepID=UPI0034CE8BD3